MQQNTRSARIYCFYITKGRECFYWLARAKGVWIVWRKNKIFPQKKNHHISCSWRRIFISRRVTDLFFFSFSFFRPTVQLVYKRMHSPVYCIYIYIRGAARREARIGNLTVCPRDVNRWRDDETVRGGRQG